MLTSPVLLLLAIVISQPPELPNVIKEYGKTGTYYF
jgi:hypothetical protein